MGKIVCFLPNQHVHKPGQRNSFLFMITVTAQNTVAAKFQLFYETLLIWLFFRLHFIEGCYRHLDSESFLMFGIMMCLHQGRNLSKLQANKTIPNFETGTCVAF